MTVSDLAERIAPGASRQEVAMLLRQLRHWSQTGVLPGADVTEIHTGRGKHRTYDFDDLCFAALALELSRWKFPVGPMRWILETLYRDVKGDQLDPDRVALWRAAVDGAKPVYLVIQAVGSIAEMQFGLSLQSTGSDLYRLMKPGDRYDGVGSVLAIDLTGIFKRLGA